MNRSVSRFPLIIHHVKRSLRVSKNLSISTIVTRNSFKSCQILNTSWNTQSKLWNSSVTSSTQDEIATIGHCPGCGAAFQKTNPSKPGYISDQKKKEKVTFKKKEQNNTLSYDEYLKIMNTLDPDVAVLLNGDSSNDPSSVPKTEPTPLPTPNVCQRCHSLRHQQHLTATESTLEFLRDSQQYGGSLEFLKTKRDPLIVTVFDVTDLPASLGALPSLIAQNPTARVLLVANKVDVLPRSAIQHENRIRDWIMQYVKSLGLSTKQILSVTLTSATKGWGISSLLRKIDGERRVTDDVYLIGCTNVGKSAIVNKLLSQAYRGQSEEGRHQKLTLKAQYATTSSSLPGTTLSTIKIPLRVLLGNIETDEQKKRFVTRERYLIDTPGVINENQLSLKLDIKDQIKLVNQQKKTPLNPVTFRLEPGKSLLLKPLVRIDLVEAESPVLVTLFTQLTPHLTRTDKLRSIHDDEPTSLLKEKSLSNVNSLVPMDKLVHVKGIHRSHASVDFSFAGIGWISLIGEFDRASFRVWLPKEVDPYQAFALREPSFLPYEYKGSIRKFFGSGERAKK